MDRHIVHLDLDSFFVSVERLLDTKLHGVPVLIGGAAERGVVASCSYEARQFGVHSAMPVKQALRLCPQAILVPGDMSKYAKYSRMVTAIIAGEAPVVEKASIDEHYLDITGMDKYFGCFKWTQELRKKIIKETSLPISFGLSVNKTVSKVATGQCKPNGELYIPPGTEKDFLAPLSLRKIPMIGEMTYKSLSARGLEKIESIQRLSVKQMEDLFGENGVTIWEKANGIDNSPVIPYSERKSMSTETTFEKDSADLEMLHKTLVTMVDELAFDLRKEQKLTSCITIKLRYANFDTYTKQGKIEPTSSDKQIIEKVSELFQKLYTRNMPIRLIGIKFSSLETGSLQTDLFNDHVAQSNLYQAMDDIKNRFGNGAIKKATSL